MRNTKYSASSFVLPKIGSLAKFRAETCNFRSYQETRRPQGVDVDFHHKGISATKPLAQPVGKSSLSYGGEGSLASRWALELDVAV